MRRISFFDVYWSRKQKTGIVRLSFDDRSSEDLRALDLEEMCLVCNMLRAEKPVFFDADSESLTTLPELVGT